MVLGSHRSGTSMIAGMLHLLGVNMGDGHLMPPTPANPKGHYEDMRFYRLNETVVTDWKNPTLWDDEDIREAYWDLADEIGMKCSVWGIKDPRMCITGGMMVEEFTGGGTEVRMIIVDRDIKAMTASMNKRDGLSLVDSARIHETYLAARDKLIKESEGNGIKTIRMVYEDVLDNPTGCAANLASFCFGDEMPSSGVVSAAAKFVDVGLNRNG